MRPATARSPWFLHAFIAAVVLGCAPWVAPTVYGADRPPAASLDERYAAEIRPLIARYCDGCHGAGETVEADLNLASLAAWNDARQQPKAWQQVKEMVSGGLMPPEDADQPKPEERAKLEQWVEAYLTIEAGARAGDPGPVVLRRLSNAEYTYTLRDLTGIESLDPAREFPIDGAAGEGFTNTGNALVMSPALVTKYLDAAKEVAAHAVLLPDGIRFSPHTTSGDWTNEILAEIRAFYAQFTEAGGDHLVVQQGVPLDVGQGGRLPLEKYFEATLGERDAISSGAKSVEVVARERGLNAKYLNTLWQELNDNAPSLVIDTVHTRWRSAKPGDGKAIANTVVELQKGLFTFAGVGLIGRAGGPKQWLEPVSPLVTQHEVRLKLPDAIDVDAITVSLIAGDAGDGNDHDMIVWHQPRLVSPGRPDLLLRDIQRVMDALHLSHEYALSLVAAHLSGANAASIAGIPWTTTTWDMGMDTRQFGGRTDGGQLDAASLLAGAPSVLTFRLPARLAAGCELVTTAALDEREGMGGTVQVRAVVGEAEIGPGLQLGKVQVDQKAGQWSSDNRELAASAPILVEENGPTRTRVEAHLEEFRQLFPAALCYTKIVPVDEVVTIVLFHREDEHLQRLMLDDAQKAHLNRLWDQLHYVSRDALKQVDVLEQVLEYASQDADPKVFEPMREPTAARAAAFRQRLLETEPRHINSVIEFAGRAYRRPLTDDEAKSLRALYQSLRNEEILHDDAIRLMLARVLVSPAFLYRAERPQEGTAPAPISDWELASRLSYFLWASQPDEELRTLAASGKLREPEVLAAQAQRMLDDARARRLATEFACHWLHVHDFDELDEKSDRHFPTFVGLRAAMYEETIQFFTHLFNENRSVLDIVSADYAYLNEELASHYGIPGVQGPEWRRVEGASQYGRGGVLAQATTLAKQSGASRTSPILRGNWVSEVMLGERLPKPPQGVPPLPDDEAATDGLTVRQLVEKHVSDPKCAVCHARIDPYGFALEKYDAIGRLREKDLGDRPIDARSQLSDGTPIDGLAGLQNYVANERRDAFVRQFCRKLLGYALGRAVQLSDEPLLAEMQTKLRQNEYRVGTAVDAIVRSKQFREIRGRDAVAGE